MAVRKFLRVAPLAAVILACLPAAAFAAPPTVETKPAATVSMRTWFIPDDSLAGPAGFKLRYF